MDVQFKWIPKDLNKRPEWDRKAMEDALKYGALFKSLLAQIMHRVIIERKHAGGGKFKKYETARKKNFVYWVSPDQPQPSSGIIQRKMVGSDEWVGYASGRDYKKRAHGSEHRNYVDTGAMWNSLRIRFRTGYSMRAAFYGSSSSRGIEITDSNKRKNKTYNRRRKKRNADKSFYAEQNESYGLLWASDKEVDDLVQEWEKMYNIALGALIRQSNTSFLLKQQTGNMNRRIERVNKIIDRELKKQSK